ncbi:MAG: acetyl-CoA acetyltransferase [Myxococcota bacterium]|nr:acetyl-CoA acetyltransferase [Myxococcota bacterium]
MESEDQQIVVVGVGQALQREIEPGKASDAVGLMADASHEAIRDAQASADLLGSLDHVVAVNVLGWRYPSAATLLCARLGTGRARPIDTAAGGNTPQSVINELARRIREGHVGAALVAGGEAIRSRRLARKAEVELSWPKEGPPPGPGHEYWGEDKPGSSDLEVRHGLFFPRNIYPMFEHALRARLGRGVAEHRAALGRLYEHFARVAADNPNAWFPTAHTAEEIATPSETNRLIASPYTKYMNAVMEVDQAAAVVVTSASRARALGIDMDRWTHLWGCGEATEEPWFVSERADLSRCPSQHRAIEGALAEAGIDADEVDAFDLYSCFPVAVELACEALGIGPDDSRPLTQTGGLAFAGGPGNAYSLAGIARMVETLRESGGTGLVTALGMYFSKHAAGVYGRIPRPGDPRAPRPAPPGEAVEVDEAPSGEGRVEAYTVEYDHTGPSRGIVLGRTDAGRRFVANTPADRDLLAGIDESEFVGARGSLRVEDEVVRFEPIDPIEPSDPS